MQTREITVAVEQVAVSRISPSASNPRRSIDEGQLAELAQSIRSVGVQVPLSLRYKMAFYVREGPGSVRYGACTNIVGNENLIRTFSGGTVEENQAEAQQWVSEQNHGGDLEIVGGERRWRAAQLAGLATVPAMVREMSDDDFREAQLIENLQREDLPALDEADIYASLIETLGSIQALAAKTGKSIDYVTRRLKLRSLIEYSRTALTSRLITIDHALLLGKLAQEEQEKALRFTLRPSCTRKDTTEDLIATAAKELGAKSKINFWRRYWEPQSVLELKKFIEQSIKLELARAPWDLADPLLVQSAGACTTCPANTGANTALFGDLAIEKATCTDAACFQAKNAAFVQLQSAAIAKAGGKAVRLSWKPSTAAPRMKGGEINAGQVFRAGQWLEAKEKSCVHVVRGITVDDDLDRHGSKKKRPMGAQLWVCVAAACKVHRKDWENPTPKRGDGPGNYNSESERLKREENAKAVAAENRIRLELARLAIEKTQKILPEILRLVLCEAAQNLPKALFADLKTAPVDGAAFAKALCSVALQMKGLEISEWQKPESERKEFLKTLKLLGVDGAKAWVKPKPAAPKAAPAKGKARQKVTA